MTNEQEDALLDDMADYLNAGRPGTPIGAEVVADEEFIYETETLDDRIDRMLTENDQSDHESVEDTPKDDSAKGRIYTSPGGKEYARQVTRGRTKMLT